MKLKDAVEYTSNPFTDIPKITAEEYMITSDNRGESMVNYVSFNLLQSLKSKGAIGMILNISYKKLYGDNETVMYQELYQEITGKKSRPSYYRALSELLNAGIIARKKHHKNMFYVNPKYIRPYKSKI